jgi:hypothetical protein
MMIIVLFVIYGALFIVLAGMPLLIGYDSWASSRSGENWEERADTRAVLQRIE